MRKRSKRQRPASWEQRPALAQAAALLHEAIEVGKAAAAPVESIDAVALATRALALLEAVGQLREQNPGGIVTADEIKALTRPDGDAVH